MTSLSASQRRSPARIGRESNVLDEGTNPGLCQASKHTLPTLSKQLHTRLQTTRMSVCSARVHSSSMHRDQIPMLRFSIDQHLLVPSHHGPEESMSVGWFELGCVYSRTDELRRQLLSPSTREHTKVSPPAKIKHRKRQNTAHMR